MMTGVSTKQIVVRVEILWGMITKHVMSESPLLFYEVNK